MRCVIVSSLCFMLIRMCICALCMWSSLFVLLIAFSFVVIEDFYIVNCGFRVCIVCRAG